MLSPSRYTVTRSDGSVWVVDTEDGLVSVAWADGSTLAVTPTGLDLEPGADLVWTRDGNGRIEALTFPDATTVSRMCAPSGGSSVSAPGNRSPCGPAHRERRAARVT